VKLEDMLKTGGKRAVFCYLLVVTLLTIYLVCSLWMAQPDPVQSGSTFAVNNSLRPIDGTPEIAEINPKTVAIGEDRANITIYGYNFSQDSTKVRFNGVDRTFHAASENELVVPLVASDFASPGTLAVAVLNTVSPNVVKTSNAANLEIKSAADGRVTWFMLRWKKYITLELRLILLVLFTGALGSSIYALKSFSDYAGEEKLLQSWYWLYIARPFVGAGLAFIFYLVIRAGFLAGTTADIKAVNPFGFVAVAALVAMFSDKALQKLSDIFDTLFKTEDTRSNKLAGLGISTQSPLPPAKQGAPYSLALSAKGGTPPYKWAAVTAPPGGLTLDAAGVLSGTPPAIPLTETPFTVQVKDSGGANSTQELKLAIQ